MTKATNKSRRHSYGIGRCECINEGILRLLERELELSHNSRLENLKRLKKEDPNTPKIGAKLLVAKMVVENTEGLLSAIRSIEPCASSVHPIPIKECRCKRNIENIDRFAQKILRNMELYKDITIGGKTVLKGDMKEYTPIDIMEMIEDTTKDIILQKIEYDRCCRPDIKIPEISKKMINVLSPIESIKAMGNIVEMNK